jgi:hypothetical protein
MAPGIAEAAIVAVKVGQMRHSPHYGDYSDTGQEIPPEGRFSSFPKKLSFHLFPVFLRERHNSLLKNIFPKFFVDCQRFFKNLHDLGRIIIGRKSVYRKPAALLTAVNSQNFPLAGVSPFISPFVFES